MSHKTAAINAYIEQFRGSKLDPHYLGFFACFNRREFFEAHEVLEDLWLLDRHGPTGDFYKALIQLAGAYVHVQKRRLGPAMALLNLAQSNLRKYPLVFQDLDLKSVLQTIDLWKDRLQQSGLPDPNDNRAFPTLQTLSGQPPLD